MSKSQADSADQAARQIQDVFRRTPLVLVGSGFSCSYGLPSMSVLGEHLLSTVGDRLESEPAKALWASALPAVRENLEQGLNTIASGAAGRNEVVLALREETARLIIEKTKVAEASIVASSDDAILAPVRLLSKLFNGSPENADCLPIITTNYDTLIELFCDLAGLPLDTGFEGLRHRRPRSTPIFQTQYTRVLNAGRRSAAYSYRPCTTVRLMKPHGSITWRSTDAGPIEVLSDPSEGTRAIVVPGPSKYEDALVNVLFDGMRSEMNMAVSRASALFCLGFGFNDDHLQGSIRRRLDEGMPAIIITRGFTKNISDLVHRYPHIIAIQQESTGASVHFDNRTILMQQPVWQLDSFLKTYLE